MQGDAPTSARRRWNSVGPVLVGVESGRQKDDTLNAVSEKTGVMVVMHGVGPTAALNVRNPWHSCACRKVRAERGKTAPP